jgi:MerR family Zn(II)-responsive transcriptional regulator of zntA
MDTAKFIKSSKECGFTLAQIASLLAIKHNKSQHVCEEAKQIAQTKISELEQEIEKLKGIKKTLEELEAYCCGGQESAEFCSILAGLETR